VALIVVEVFPLVRVIDPFEQEVGQVPHHLAAEEVPGRREEEGGGGGGRRG